MLTISKELEYSISNYITNAIEYARTKLRTI
jgi:hypothetical protein